MRSLFIAPLGFLSLIPVWFTPVPQTPAPPGPTPRALTAYATVQHPPLDEMSGIVASRKYPGTFWVHNDSGDEARVFAIRADGNLVMPSYLASEFYANTPSETDKNANRPPYPGVRILGATAFDWEDLAYDGDNLYLADMGNNGNARRDLGVYVLPEPNPNAVNAARFLKWLPVAYPDQTAYPPSDEWRFDCEAVFFRNGSLYFVTKHRVGTNINAPANGANLYKLDLSKAKTDSVNTLTKVDGVGNLGGWVTAASISPDGNTLAVLCHAPVQSVWLFEMSGKGDKFLTGASRTRRLVFTGARQCEAICWENPDTLLLTNEQRDLFRLPIGEIVTVGKP